jgi:hypothetical protein
VTLKREGDRRDHSNNDDGDNITLMEQRVVTLDSVNKKRRCRVMSRKVLLIPLYCSGSLALAMLMSEEKAHRRTVHGNPCDGKLHTRFKEGSPETW